MSCGQNLKEQLTKTFMNPHETPSNISSGIRDEPLNLIMLNVGENIKYIAVPL